MDVLVARSKSWLCPVLGEQEPRGGEEPGECCSSFSCGYYLFNGGLNSYVKS